MNIEILRELTDFFLPVGINMVKITGDNNSTLLDAVNDDKNLIIHGQFNTVVSEFAGIFGLSMLDRLKTIINIPTYTKHANIVIMRKPDGNAEYIEFSNQIKDFVNTHRLMGNSLVTKLVPCLEMPDIQWGLEFSPSIEDISRFKQQNNAASNEVNIFTTEFTKRGLMIEMGDPSSNQGKFLFQTAAEVTGKGIKKMLNWSSKHVLAVLSLIGKKTIYISDNNLMKIKIETNIANYEFYIMSQNK